MTDKERAVEYAITYGIGDNMNVSDYIDFAVAFAQEETKLLSEHIIELQNDKGKLIDENRKMREIIKELFPFAKREAVSSANPNAKEIKRAEQFLGE